jgi:hypothetical protein
MRRTVHQTRFVFFAATGVLILLLAQRRTDSQNRENLTNPLPNLTRAQLMDFNAGLDEFEEVDTIEEGLGPVFNGKSCAECHAVPSTGGSEPNVGVARETRISRIFNGHFDPLDGSVSVDRGGQLLQQRAIELPGCKLNAEDVPPEATIDSLRITTPLFGAGLMEAIPEPHYFGEPGQRRQTQLRVEPRYRTEGTPALRLEGASRYRASVRRGRLPQRDGHYQPQFPTGE